MSIEYLIFVAMNVTIIYLELLRNAVTLHLVFCTEIHFVKNGLKFEFIHVLTPFYFQNDTVD